MCPTAHLATLKGINTHSHELHSESTLGCKDHPSARLRTEPGTLIAVASQGRSGMEDEVQGNSRAEGKVCIGTQQLSRLGLVC